ncbi:MAG: 30S ribosomal protein S17e [Nitrososphaerota archaeon]
MRTRKVKVLAKQIRETYGDAVSVTFEENKKLVRSVLQGRFSKRFANRVAGYITALVKGELKPAQHEIVAPEVAEETANP